MKTLSLIQTLNMVRTWDKQEILISAFFWKFTVQSSIKVIAQDTLKFALILPSLNDRVEKNSIAHSVESYSEKIAY